MKHIILPIGQTAPNDHKPPEPAPAQEWQTDANGKRFRNMGTHIEYMPTITIDGVEVENTPEAVHEFNQARAAATAKARAQETARQQSRRTGRFCPLYKDLQTMRECTTDCALYVGDSCALTAYSAERDTVGKPCPFMRQCTPSCALYRNGCTLTNIMGMMPGKKV